MTTLLQEILAGVSVETLATRDPSSIAAEISQGRTRPKSTELGDGTIIDAIGDLTAANAFLDVVKSTSPTNPYRHIKDVIARGVFDISKPMAIAGVNAMVGGPLTREQADALISLGQEPDLVSEFDVRCVMWDAQGNWLGG